MEEVCRCSAVGLSGPSWSRVWPSFLFPTRARAERDRRDRRLDRRSVGGRAARRHRHRHAARRPASRAPRRRTTTASSGPAAAGRRLRPHRRARRLHAAQAAGDQGHRRTDGDAAHRDGVSAASPRPSPSPGGTPIIETEPHAGELDGQRERGAEPAGQRPQLHRLRAADARRHARRRAPATSASPASAARSTAWSSTAPTTTTRSSARPSGRTGSGRAPYQFSQDAVKEFQVNSNAFSAEYGRAGGAVINVVTKSGTNDLHGSVVRVLPRQGAQREQRHQRAEQPAEVAVPLQPVRRHARRPDPSATATSSSPTTTASATRSRTSSSSTCRRTRRPTRRPRRASRGCSRSPRAGSRALDQDVFLVKTDHELNDGQPPVAPLQPPELHRRGLRERRRRRTRSSTPAPRSCRRARSTPAGPSIVGTTLFNELRFQFARDKEPGDANSANPEGVVQQSGTTVLTIGRNNFSPRETTIKRWQVADTADLGARRAQVQGRLRLSVRRHPQPLPRASSAARTRSAAWRRSPAAGRTAPTSSISRTSPAPARPAPMTHPNIHEYSFFVQDEWRPRQRPHAQPRPALRPDEDRGAAGAEPRPAARGGRHRHQPPRRRHQQLGPAPRRRLEPGRRARSWSAAARASSTAARRRSCSAPRTRTTASTSCRSRSPATRCRPIRRQLRSDPGAGTAVAADASSTSTRTSRTRG